MHVLVAPGRFDARLDDGPSRPRAVAGVLADPWPVLTAPQAVAAITDGWSSAVPTDTFEALPLSDGGPGLLDVIRAARGGELVAVSTTDAHGGLVPGAVLVVAEPSGLRTAYVDGALALGAVAPGARSVTATTSAGLGTLIAAALDTGADRIVVGLGGRRTVAHDAGAGMLAALGAGSPVLAGGLAGASTFGTPDLAALADLRSALGGRDLVALHAHDLPLIGLGGASADLADAGRVDAAGAQDVERMVAAFVHLAAGSVDGGGRRDLLAPGGPSAPPTGAARVPGARAALVPGSGAGGGAAFAFTLLGARLVDGTAWVADAVDLAGRAAEADLVVTGTGVLDGSALEHGVVAAVAGAALPLGVPAIALAAQVRTGRRDWGAAGLAAGFAVLEHPDDDARWRADAAQALRARLPRIARTWSH